MMVALVLWAALASAPVKVASVGLAPSGGVTAEQADFVSEQFGARLATERGFEVTTRKAISTLLGLERQRQLLGCADDSTSCMEELAGALGADVVLVGELARLDASVQANLRAVDARGARVLHVVTVRAASQEALLDGLDEAVHELASALRQHFGLAAAPPRWQPWVLVGAGALSAGVGVVFFVEAGQAWNTLSAPAVPSVTPADAAALAQQGARNQALGVTLATAGALAIAGGLLWYGLGGRGPAVSVWLTPGEARVALAWRWP